MLLALARRILREADADGDGLAVQTAVRDFGDLLAHPFHDGMGFAMRLVRVQDGEFLPAVPGYEIIRAGIGLNDVRDGFQHGVPGAVAVRIVHFFEIIDIHDGQLQRQMIALVLVDQPPEILVERDVVVQIGQCVGLGQLVHPDRLHEQLLVRLEVGFQMLQQLSSRLRIPQATSEYTLNMTVIVVRLGKRDVFVDEIVGPIQQVQRAAC